MAKAVLVMDMPESWRTWRKNVQRGFNACLNEIMRQGMSDSVD